MKKLFYILLGALFVLGAIGFPHYVKAYDVISLGDLTVHFIDVGQGDSCFVELPDDRTMLIDAGVADKGKKVESYIKENIKDDSGNEITFIDFVIFTHSDADHIGGMSYVLSKFYVGTVYRSNEECKYSDCVDGALSGENERNRFWGDKHGTKNTKTYHEAIESAYKFADEVIVTNPEDETQNEIVSTNEKYYSINFYSPLSPYYTDLNNHSPIIVIEYMGRRIVLSGDAEKQNEAEFVERARAGEGRYSIFDNFCADVIKLGHHGSRTSSSEDYLDLVASGSGRKNAIVVISCGADNKYGHPHREVLERLKNMGFNPDRILRTDLSGDIVITIVESDGIFKAVCVKGALKSEGVDGNESSGDNLGGSENSNESESSKDKGSLAEFNKLSLPHKLIIAAVIVLIVLVIITVMLKSKKRRRKRR